MGVRRRYRYEKDILGRKHRKYFLENVFAADISDMKTFRALRSKLSRDYLGFFKGLGKLYEKGEFKQVADESVSSINRTINLIDSIVESGVIDKKDVDIIIENVSEVNVRKDVLVEKSEQVKALKGKLVSIEKITGVRPEDLSVTRKLIKYGAGREAKKGREGVLPFLRKTMPKTFGLAGEMAGSLGTAALGPFAPIAKAVGGFAGDIFGLGRGITEKFGERKERRMGRYLTPMSMGMSEEAMGQIRYRRGHGETVAGVAGGSRKSAASSVLMDFFSKGAYKAKWTKELLKKMKGLFSKGKKGAEIGGLAGMLSSFGTALGGLIGPAGKLALLGGAAYLTTNRLITLGEKSFEYLDVLNNVSRLKYGFEL